MLDDTAIRYYRDKLQKTGIALTQSQFVEHLKKHKIPGTRQDVAKFLAQEHLTARFSKSTRPKAFQTIAVMRPGVYFMDYAEFHKSWAWHNSGMTGFLLAVENVTNRLFVSPCKTKDTSSWENAIENFVELTRNVSTIFSDRDSVATSNNFRLKIMKNHQINWFFLKKGSKAYLAERYIGFVKTKLSQALASRTVQTKNWIQFVQPLVNEYNNQKVEGTTYRRQTIDVTNFNEFLQQKLKTNDPEATFNGFKVGPFVNEKWNSLVFKYALGQHVLLARKANWSETAEKSGPFTKHSTVGGFGPKIYTISGRQLRQTKESNKNFVAVYSLEELGKNLNFYDAELRAVN